METKHSTVSKFRILLFIIAGLVLSVTAASYVSTKESSALSPSDFNPGRIIDDTVFYNNNSMSVQQIQTFLNQKMPNCDTNGTKSISYYYNPQTKYVSYGTWKAGASWVNTTRAIFGERTYQYRKSVGLPDNNSRAPYKCLKDYRMNTPQEPSASTYCSQINAMTNASAAQIIKAVADACGINPQVILVILEKEQSLVAGDDWPFGTRYSHAMGYACPDTAACDVNYEGLYKQIYHGAKQFKIYQKFPHSYNYRAGVNNRILFNPDSRCGSSQVFIQNQATAGLYIYTPYQPNNAAKNMVLGNGPGVSANYPGCGAFGNVNFFMLFSKWFGDPTYEFPVKGGIAGRYKAMGANSGILGYPKAKEASLSTGGSYQQFDNGRIYWKTSVGGWPVSGSISTKYIEAGADKSPLGYPAGPEIILETGGVYQQFEKGRAYWKPGVSTWFVVGGIYTAHMSTGANESTLGYPTEHETILETGGTYQQFENGRIYWKSGIGAWSIEGEIAEKYNSMNGPSGILKHPASKETDLSNGVKYQQFENGRIYISSEAEPVAVLGGVFNKYMSIEDSANKLGHPTSEEQSLESSGAYQQFEKGRIYWKAGIGAWPVLGGVMAKYIEAGADTSLFGYPVSEETSLVSGGTYQQFEKGLSYWKPGAGAWFVRAGINTRYQSLGANTGILGFPTGGEVILETGGVYQQFEKGRIYWKAGAGTWPVVGIIGEQYNTLGADTSDLGYPIAQEFTYPTTGTIRQDFQNGFIQKAVNKDFLVHVWPEN